MSEPERETVVVPGSKQRPEPAQDVPALRDTPAEPTGDSGRAMSDYGFGRAGFASTFRRNAAECTFIADRSPRGKEAAVGSQSFRRVLVRIR
jgi:hypothetical protein